MKNKIILISSIIIIIGLISVVLYFNLLKFKAAESNLPTLIGTQASVSYKDASNITHNETSDLVQIQKVALFPVTLDLQGKNANTAGVSGTLTISRYDNPSQANQDYGPFNFSFNNDTKTWSLPDWTSSLSPSGSATLPALNLDLKYDLKVSSPGYLAKIIPDQMLTDTANITISLLAGNVDNNNIINYDDYIKWDAAYGKDAPAGSELASYDYNGDGVLNYKDFAIAFGSTNYNKTVNAQ